MDMERFFCPDCGDEHDEPGQATLGFRVRCIDCQIETDLAIELSEVLNPAA